MTEPETSAPVVDWAELSTHLNPWVVEAPLDERSRALVRATFHELGFVVVRGLFADDEIDELQADLWRVHHALMTGELDRRHAAPELEPDGAVEIDGLPFCNYVVYATQASPVAERMIKGSEIATLAPSVIDGPSYFYDYDRHGAMYLDARGASSYKGLVWHPDFESTADLPIWPATAFTINLDATSPENGFLRMLPGSHRTPPARRPEGYEKVDGEVAVYCERGDLLLHHSHLWHAAGRPSNDAALRRHIRGKWCSGDPIPAGSWNGAFNRSATALSGD